MAKKEILPDEYIWETFFKFPDSRNCTNCFQLHIIEYLLMHSDSFTKKFRDQCEEWIALHAEKRAECGVEECSDRKKIIVKKPMKSKVNMVAA